MALAMSVLVAGFMALTCMLVLPQAGASGVVRVRRNVELGAWLVRRLEVLGETDFVQALATLGRVGRVADDMRGWFMKRWGLELSTPASVSALLVMWGAAALVATWWSVSLAGAFVVAMAAVAWLLVKSSALERRAARELAEELPGLFRAVSGSLAAGQSLPQAIAYAAGHGRGEAARAFGRVSMRLRCGESIDAALAQLGRELEAPGVGMLVSALRISRRTGSPLGDLLEEAAELVERQQEYERLLAVKTAQARLSSRIVCSMPVAMVGLLLLISPDFQRGAGTFVGMAAIVASALLDAIAFCAIRSFMRGVV